VKKLAIVLWGLMLFAVQPVAGQFVPDQLATQPEGSVDVNFVGTNNAIDGLAVAFGAVVGPYRGLVDGFDATLYCVDFTHHVSNGNYWSAFATALNDGASTDVSATRLGNYTIYRNAAFLASLYSVVTPTKANWTALQGGIWSLTNPTDFASVAGASAAQYSLAALFDPTSGLLKDYSGYAGRWETYDPSSWSVLSWTSSYGTTPDERQEFLVQSTVPEPETYVLLLSGLVMIFFVARRRMKENGYI